MRRSSFYLLFFFICTIGCARLQSPADIPVYPASSDRMTGSVFFGRANILPLAVRDSIATMELLKGNFPRHINHWVTIHTTFTDHQGKRIKASYQVTSDYLSVGTDADWCRVPLTPMAAQRIADAWHCFLPTRKMVDEIYAAAKVKLEPVPMYAFRDSPVTMYQHHLIIEGQRKGQKGLIAGIKKDLVLSPIVINHVRPNREAIYGWHRLNGKAIQPLYAGHVNWYVDYSHGVRLVNEIIRVNGRKMHYREVLQDTLLRKLLTEEMGTLMMRYDTLAPIPRN